MKVLTENTVAALREIDRGMHDMGAAQFRAWLALDALVEEHGTRATARMLGIPVSTLKRWADDPHMVPRRLGRIVLGLLARTATVLDPS